MLKDTIRLTSQGCSDLVMEIACGLYNLRVLFRHFCVVLISWIFLIQLNRDSVYCRT